MIENSGNIQLERDSVALALEATAHIHLLGSNRDIATLPQKACIAA